MKVGSPIQHRDLPHVVGVVQRAFFEGGTTYYVVEWSEEGFAPNVREDHVRSLPSALHLLAHVG
jgi:hypothetical protein